MTIQEVNREKQAKLAREVKIDLSLQETYLMLAILFIEGSEIIYLSTSA
jgi:hypothetical protein